MFGTIVTPNSAKQPTTTKTPRSRAVVSAAAAAAAAVESNRGEKGGGGGIKVVRGLAFSPRTQVPSISQGKVYLTLVCADNHMIPTTKQFFLGKKINLCVLQYRSVLVIGTVRLWSTTSGLW